MVYHPNYLSHNSRYTEDMYRSDLLTALTYLFENFPGTKPPQVHQIPQLHCHSDFSVGDSIRSPEDMAKVAANLGITHLALTDHGTMAGVYQFESACRKHGVQPIIGYEGYIQEIEEGDENSCTVIIDAHPVQNDTNKNGKKYWTVNMTHNGEHLSKLTLGKANEVTETETMKELPEKFNEWLNGRSQVAKQLKKEWGSIDYILSIDNKAEGPGKGHMTIWVKSPEGWKNLIIFIMMLW
jgi:hypothetical protein